MKNREAELLELANFEKSEKEAALGAISKLAARHISQINEIRKSSPVDNTDLITVNISNPKISIDKKIAQDVNALHDRIKIIIDNVSQAIENKNYESTELSIQALDLGYKDRERANNLISADKERLISCRAISITMDVFSNFNKTLSLALQQAVDKNDSANTRKLLFANAILIYELADYLINFIDSFQIAGRADLNALCEESKKKISNARNDLSIMESEDTSGIIAEEIENRKKHIEFSQAALNKCERAWDDWMREIDKVDNDIVSVKTQMPTLQSIRARAKSQLSVLEAVSILSIARTTIEAMSKAVVTLTSMKLETLSEDRIRLLLNA